MERSFPWHLIEKIGVNSRQTYQQVTNIVDMATHKPPVNLEMNWYY